MLWLLAEQIRLGIGILHRFQESMPGGGGVSGFRVCNNKVCSVYVDQFRRGTRLSRAQKYAEKLQTVVP